MATAGGSEPSGGGKPPQGSGTGFALSSDSRTYHEAELRLAFSPDDRRHILPPTASPGSRVLDVGCGAGQSLLAVYPDRVSFGVDIDLGALRLGTTWTQQVRFTCAGAEALPFANGCFDQVFSRVALPYTDLRRSLREIHRVLKPGGTIWMALHPASHSWRQALRDRSYKAWIYFAYVVVNSAGFHCWGRLLPWPKGGYESFQTVAGMTRALQRIGFREISFQKADHFVFTAKRPKAPTR
jgi:SAM-dependent methyltransferase